MNCLRNSRSLLLYKPAAVPPRPTRGFFPRHIIKQAAVCPQPALLPLPRRYSTTSPRSPVTRFGSRWYHDPRKVTALAVVISGATVMAVYRRYLEIVPYTNRSHLVVISPQSEREFWESRLAEDRKRWASQSQILDPLLHPDSVRVRLITEKIVGAAHRTLGINSHDDVMLRGSPRKDASTTAEDLDGTCATATESRKQGKAARGPQPQTRHLDGLNWEVILVKDEQVSAMSSPDGKIIVFTGLLDHLKTDAEIAFAIGHEVGHVIARHSADIAHSKWFPTLLRLALSQTMEIEADYIGILLLGAAGFDPHVAHTALKKLAKTESEVSVLEYYLSTHPPFHKRLQFLSQTKVMEKAFELYRDVTAMRIVVDRYFGR